MFRLLLILAISGFCSCNINQPLVDNKRDSGTTESKSEPDDKEVHSDDYNFELPILPIFKPEKYIITTIISNDDNKDKKSRFEKLLNNTESFDTFHDYIKNYVNYHEKRKELSGLLYIYKPLAIAYFCLTKYKDFLNKNRTRLDGYKSDFGVGARNAHKTVDELFLKELKKIKTLITDIEGKISIKLKQKLTEQSDQDKLRGILEYIKFDKDRIEERIKKIDETVSVTNIEINIDNIRKRTDKWAELKAGLNTAKEKIKDIVIKISAFIKRGVPAYVYLMLLWYIRRNIIILLDYIIGQDCIVEKLPSNDREIIYKYEGEKKDINDWIEELKKNYDDMANTINKIAESDKKSEKFKLITTSMPKLELFYPDNTKEDKDKKKKETIPKNARKYVWNSIVEKLSSLDSDTIRKFSIALPSIGVLIAGLGIAATNLTGGAITGATLVAVTAGLGGLMAFGYLGAKYREYNSIKKYTAGAEGFKRISDKQTSDLELKIGIFFEFMREM